MLHLIVAARGALNGLMTEVIEDHIRLHLVDASKDTARTRGAEELIEAVGLFEMNRSEPVMADVFADTHSHVFLGEGHERNERRTWIVIALCAAMMVAEIVGGLLLGSIALVADGLHMSTHASALL